MSDPDVYEAGHGAPLLLLHGGMATWRDWKPAIPTLEGQRRVVAPTLPGSHGGPPLELGGRPQASVLADYAEQVLDARGLRDPLAIATHSFGGVVGLELAARGRASSVVAFAPPFVYTRAIALRYLLLFLPFKALLSMTRPWHRRMGPAFGVSDPDDMAIEADSFARFPLLRSMREGPMAAERPFERVRCPVTFAYGTADWLAPRSMMRRFTEALPHAKALELEGLPHGPQRVDPKRIAAIVLDETTT